MLKLSIFLLLILVSINNVQAQTTSESTGLVVSPAIIELALEKGKVYSRDLIVKSTSTQPTGFVVSIEHLKLADYATVSDQELSPPDWIKPVQQEFILNPGDVRKLSIVFSPAKDTPPGGYYGTLYIQPVADSTKLSQAKTTSVPKLGVLLLAKVEGKTISHLVFTGFKNKFITTNKAVLILGFENLGNVHAMPNGEVIMSNLLTKQQTRLPLPPALIFPNTYKELSLKPEVEINTGIYKISYKSQSETKAVYTVFTSSTSILLSAILTFLLTLVTLYLRRKFILQSRRENYKQ